MPSISDPNSVGDIEHQAVGKAMLELGLECIGLRMAVISVTQYEIA